MIIITLFLILCIFTAVSIMLHYYITLFLSKEEYTKNELKNVTPYFKNFWAKITEEFSTSTFMAIFMGAACVGAIIPQISLNWFLNSIFPFAILYFSLPFLAAHLLKRQVAQSGTVNDTIANMFIKYHEIITAAFGLGSLTSFSYNWVTTLNTGFLLFAVNLIAAIILIEYLLTGILKKEK